MPPAATLTGMHTCPMVTGVVPHVGGPILETSAETIIVGALPGACVTSVASCVGPPDTVVQGAPTVMYMALPAARMGDMTAHGGVITLGEPTVLVG